MRFKHAMRSSRLTLLAASLRIVLGLAGIVVLPLLYPGLATWKWLYWVYIAWSLFTLLLISKEIGGIARSIIDAFVDIALITFIVHRIGSVSTVLVAVYVIMVIFNMLVVGRRVGVVDAILACASYNAIVLAEAAGLLPYAPDAPAAIHLVRPTLTQAVMFVTITNSVLIVATMVVAILLQRIRLREAQLVEANTQLEELSQRDPLTQLYNRRHLLRRVQDELAWVHRGRPMAVVMLDLDRFKRVNDEHGHLQGDALLRRVAQALGSHSRATDVAGRFGGDEFVVLLPDTSPEQALTAAERLRAAVLQVGLEFDADLPVTASIGLAFARATDTPAEVLRRADRNAYDAKQAGGDRVVVTPGASATPDSGAFAG